MRPIVSELYTMSTSFLQQRLLCMCMKIKDHFIILGYLFRVKNYAIPHCKHGKCYKSA